ncbi:hypothetical protein FH5_01304 [Priestia endophytica]|nr:hypothetical protein FH5_01304 [Priestia endophytica]
MINIVTIIIKIFKDVKSLKKKRAPRGTLFLFIHQNIALK